MPILDGTVTNWRTDFLIEHLKTADKVTTYCAVRNEAYVLVGNGTDELELYDLAADPYQLTSVAHDPGYRDVVRDLTRRLESLCRPPPPGYQPP